MSSTLFTNIKLLAGVSEGNSLLRGNDLRQLNILEDAYLLLSDGLIAAYGSMDDLEEPASFDGAIVNASDQVILPAWCDSHTHLVFPASREGEFVDKIGGATYSEIAAKGGGILNSAAKMADATEMELLRSAWGRLQEVMQQGTGAIEIKSGYGLTVASELKMLRVIRKLKEMSPIAIRSTFLGAHTYPSIYKDDHEPYIRQVIDEMLPVIAHEGLADYIDVFCDTGFFSPKEMARICEAGIRYGLQPKVHVNQLTSIGGIEEAIRLNAVSVDHLETMSGRDIDLLAASPVIATLLPSAAFFLRMNYQPARALVDAGAAIALASDYNPGSSPSGNMNFVLSLACIQLRLLPEEAINAATINGAFAMGLQEEAGSIAVGKRANIILTKPVPSIAYIPYSFGTSSIDRVYINGEPV